MEIPLNKKEFRKLVKSIRNKLFEKDPHCYYCQIYLDFPTLDHKIPLSKGGKTTFHNCVLACEDCNNKKADNEVQSYLHSRESKEASDVRGSEG